MDRLACTACGRTLEVADIDRNLGLAHCAGCGAVWQLGGATVVSTPPRPPPARPAAWVEQTSADGLVLRRRWFGVHSIFPLGFALMWNGMLWFGFLGMAWAEGGRGEMLLFATPHGLLGLGLLWHGAAQILNTTNVRVGGGGLAVTHGPVWWPGSSELRSEDVHQLYVAESSVRVNQRPRWNLMVLDRDRVTRTLLRYVGSLEEARWLEYRVEQALGLEDQPVAEEVPKSR